MSKGFGWRFAIIDKGCNRSVTGRRWTEEYITDIGQKDRKKAVIKNVTNRQKFILGEGKVFAAKDEVKALVMIGNKHYSLG